MTNTRPILCCSLLINFSLYINSRLLYVIERCTFLKQLSKSCYQKCSGDLQLHFMTH